jgi:hypothetical protein
MPSFRQPNLFGSPPGATPEGLEAPTPALVLGAELLRDWQGRVASLQAVVTSSAATGHTGQLSLAAAAGFTGGGTSREPAALAAALDPFRLTAQNLEFWRWPAAPQQGAAIYFVVDRPPHLEMPLLLYVGETGKADRRWKGEHDCKGYLAAYSEALHRAELRARLSIRFWCDVPAAVRGRRALEQALIRRWLPPFNKETRERWVTPFTADPA